MKQSHTNDMAVGQNQETLVDLPARSTYQGLELLTYPHICVNKMCGYVLVPHCFKWYANMRGVVC